MLDIKFIRENTEAIKTAIVNKRIKLDLDELLAADDKRRGSLQAIEVLRTDRNALAAAGSKGKPSDEQIAKGRELKEKLAKLEGEYQLLNEAYLDLMAKVPTVPAADAPLGRDESENVEVRKSDLPQFDFEPRTYIELAKMHGLIDFERGTKVAGYRGYYLKNETTTLVLGAMLYALNKLIAKGFTPMIPPTLIREFALFGSGYFAGRTYDPGHDEIYQIANDEKLEDGSTKHENKFLVGTAEPSLLAYHADEILAAAELPKRFAGFSGCYRSEIGSYGKDAQGMYRVHEFYKVEMVSILPADIELANRTHEEMIGISREMHEELGLPYRQLAICTGDMSAGKYKQYDLEAWLPGTGRWAETGSASNFLDWQARRLNVRYADPASGEKKPVYMINNTALASPRTLIAILENHQQADGRIKIPAVLQPYLGGREFIG